MYARRLPRAYRCGPWSVVAKPTAPREWLHSMGRIRLSIRLRRRRTPVENLQAIAERIVPYCPGTVIVRSSALPAIQGWVAILSLERSRLWFACAGLISTLATGFERARNPVAQSLRSV